MGYPVWQTPSGFLGKIAELEFYNFQFEASDPDQQDVTFSLIAGRLPSGLQLTSTGYTYGQPADNFKISGTPRAVNQDVDFKFTIRAQSGTNTRAITDRTFTITITGNRVPTITTNTEPLGIFLDGTQIDITLEAVDLDNDPLSWTLIDGELPPGLTLSTDGVVSGIVLPFVNLPESAGTGYDNSRWDLYPWQFNTKSSDKTYKFTVQVSDGKVVNNKAFTIRVISYNSLTADNTTLTADTDFITADSDQKRKPLLLTTDLGAYATFKSDNFFAFKFEGLDLDGDVLEYTLLGNSPADGFASDSTNFDMGIFDKGLFTLIPGVNLNQTTGWLTGYIPAQIEAYKEYTFGIQVYKRDYPSYITQIRLFTLTILGNLDLAVDWITGSDLGLINSGEISKIAVEAVARSGKNLYYELTSNSHLPQGLKLLNDGNISGRCTFQSFSLDKGTTTFDETLRDRGFLPADTVFDRTFTFSVIAAAADDSISSQKTFTLKINTIVNEPYENVYLRCLPEETARDQYAKIVNNGTIFPINSLYRPNDPYWGRQNEVVMLSAYGLRASEASDYIEAMQDRHYNKKIFFGNYGTSIARDPNTNEIIYEVIWVDLIEDTRAYKNGIKQGDPQASTDLITKINGWENPGDGGSIIKINDQYLMRRDLVNALGYTYPPALPEWMVSVQKDRTVPGFVTRAVLAYVKPGKGDEVLFNLRKLSTEKTIPDIKDVPFVADRYVLDNNLSRYFDLTERKFLTHEYTTFDLEPKEYNNITLKATVDFAVEIPFEYINGRTTAEVDDLGGLDGIVTSYNNATIIFAKQEDYIGYTVDTANDGWIRYNQPYGSKYDDLDFDDATIIPGYVENGGNPTIPNQRAGVWQITYTTEGLINLVSIQSDIEVDDILLVRYGAKYGGNRVKYDQSTIVDLTSVPNYTSLEVAEIVEPQETTFDGNNTKFVNNVDPYLQPFENNSYLKFPKTTVFT
jgi:hypothetical protein